MSETLFTTASGADDLADDLEGWAHPRPASARATVGGLLAAAAAILVVGVGAVVSSGPPASGAALSGPPGSEVAPMQGDTLPVIVSRPVSEEARSARRWFPDVPPIDLDVDEG